MTVLVSGPEVIKLFLMLNSVEHKILNAHVFKISRNSAFLGLDKPRMLFCPLRNFNIYEQEKFHAQVSMEKVL